MKYSDNQLTALAQNNPKELARLLTNPNVETRILTYGVEILGGEVTDESLVLPVFRQLLKHVNAIVREGAMVGVAAFYCSKIPPQDIVDRLIAMKEHDPSAYIKEYAKSLLDDYVDQK